MKKVNKGDLVWIPSEVRLVRFDNLEDKMVIKHKLVEEPKHAVVIGEESSYYEVLHEGERWYTPKKEVYNVDKTSRNSQK